VRRNYLDAIDERDFYDPEDLRDQPDHAPDDAAGSDEDESDEADRGSEDAFATARGIVTGLLLAVPFWSIVIWRWL